MKMAPPVVPPGLADGGVVCMLKAQLRVENRDAPEKARWWLLTKWAFVRLMVGMAQVGLGGFEDS